MFKTTQDKLSDIERTGSHATKPFATGRVEVLPVEARPWEEVYLTFRDQYETAFCNLDAAFSKLRALEIKLLETLPVDELARELRMRKQYLAQVAHHKEILASLRRDCDKASRNSLAYCFMLAARRVLTDEQYAACVQSAEAMKAGFPSEEKTPGFQIPLSVWHGETENQASNRREKFRMAMNPNANRTKRMLEKQKKYGDSRLSEKARSPDYRIVHKEF